MKRLTFLILVILTIGLIVAACAAPPEAGSVKVTNISGYVTRYVDKEAGVACWVVSQGISCLPISQTKLGD